ncbi:hypothetical protein PHLGIDRAFT_15394 [Phlebiopsis gigantea 11061_1 CR5-6]|uniref:Uncharacterized protein n=1 Tax=Phlebiopsis gigantea (strain 11061_1 CR5-6) TaxID=745531 RepID=A0A0C3S6H3_PHLG1|nr:hypothetical protein PHLGIDRAFT_15394 [Phlebiopsis gigantea 11061_1 CR5-6]
MSWWPTRGKGDQHPVQQGHSTNSNHHRAQQSMRNAYYHPTQATGHRAPVPTVSGVPAAVAYPSHHGHHATQWGQAEYSHHGGAPTGHHGGMATPAIEHYGNHGGATAPTAHHHGLHGGAPAQYYVHHQHTQTPAPTAAPPPPVTPHGHQPALRKIHFTKEAEKQIEDLNKTDPRFRGNAQGMHVGWIQDYAAANHPNATRANVRKAAHAGGTNESEIEHTTVSFKGPGEDGHGRHIYARFPEASEGSSRMAPSDARSGAQYNNSTQDMGYFHDTMIKLDTAVTHDHWQSRCVTG